MTDQTDDQVTDEEGSALLVDPPEPAADGPAAADDQPADDTEAGPQSNSEAARYRRKLREAEAERDTLRGRLEAVQRREAERVAAGVLADPSDLFGFAELADLLNEGGDVDASLVTAKAEDLVRVKPHFGRPAEMPVKRGEGRPRMTNEDTAGGGPRPPSWAEVLGGQAQ